MGRAPLVRCFITVIVLTTLVSEQEPIQVGDWVKIELGCHVDYYMAVVAHTVKVGIDTTEPGAVTGEQADVMLAAYYAAEVAAKTIKAGNTNTQVCYWCFLAHYLCKSEYLKQALKASSKQYSSLGTKCASCYSSQILFPTS